MNHTTTATPTSGGITRTPAFWERLWRTAGIQFVALFVLAYIAYGQQPGIGASQDELAAFFDGRRPGILLAAALSGVAILNLVWFAAAIRNTLADAGKDGWGAAATASSAMVGGLFLLLVGVSATLAYTSAGSGNGALASGLNDLAWGLMVVTSFPRAMLIMSGAFGLWRAGLISDALFGAGVAAVVLVLLGGTTWLSDGIWAPDGDYTRFVTPVIDLLWILVVSGVLLTRSSSARAGW